MNKRIFLDVFNQGRDSFSILLIAVLSCKRVFFSCIVDSSNAASLICILSIIEFTFSKTWLGEEVSSVQLLGLHPK